MFSIELPIVILLIIFNSAYIDAQRSTADIFHECVKKSVERAEEEANVVFTGTIQDIYKDYQHPQILKANVEVKRVLKGNNVLNTIPAVASSNNLPWGRKTVVVDGIANPDICESFARKYDTRIFLLNKGSDGQLHLNSSLIRLTLNNIIRADAAVQDKPYTPLPLPTDPCVATLCAFGAKCHEDPVTHTGVCRCITRCQPTWAPVCGSDGVTYTNECEVRKASCHLQKRIVVARKTTCDMVDPCADKDCAFGAVCVPSIDGSSARCQCPVCEDFGDHDEAVPVCGTDGRDYENSCQLNKNACLQMLDIEEKYKGKCDPCEGHVCSPSQVCQLDDDRNPVCRCNTVCTFSLEPVCGNEGKTYSNECYLHVEACKQGQGHDLFVQYSGACDSRPHPCDAVRCADSEECMVDRFGNARCTCPPRCPKLFRPVCGTDGTTYDNVCELERQSCLHHRTVRVAFYGHCSADSVCVGHFCDFGAICVVKGNQATCECPKCSEEFEPVCGTDNVSYNNECKLRQEACEERTNITVQYTGLCNLCRNVVCDYYAVCDNGKCVCPSACVDVFAPVCGSDGKTYDNECELHIASCQSKTSMQKTSEGSCDLCLGVKCNYGSVCEAGVCLCPLTTCPQIYEPVCASDAVTYSNECTMRQAGCRNSIHLEVVSRGECEDEEASGSGDGGFCYESTCKYGGECAYDTSGDYTCQCNFRCSAVRDPVCGSDGRLHASECLLGEESCRLQQPIIVVPMDNCEDLEEELCDGEAPLVNRRTGREFDCDVEICPANSYCHRVGALARCCAQETTVKTCRDFPHGCCPDKKTPALGANNAGCPSVCQCNPLGSIGMTCDPQTKQCTCRAGVGGLRCDRCEPGYWGLPQIADGNVGCMPCGCNIYGSVREDCEQMTGRCSCIRPGMGQKCDVCPDGRDVTANGCDGMAMARTCDELHCDFGAVCRYELGVANCVCPETVCNINDEQVCGTDGQTYSSECQLRQLACRQQRPLNVFYLGPCIGLDTSSPNRPKKTTRHVIESPPTKPPLYGIVGDNCAEDRDCFPDNSRCHRGRCECVEMYTPSVDLTKCEATQCLAQPCGDREVCVPNSYHSYHCLCHIGYGGSHCTEEISYTTPAFSGQSYLRLMQLHHANREIAIELTFKSLNQHGILLYAAQSNEEAAGPGDFVALTINDGFVEFSYNLGSGAVTLRSATPISLNKFHRVVAKRFNRDGVLRMDDGQEVTGQSPGQLTSLNLKTYLYLGYVPDLIPSATASLGVGLGLVGCIESLRIEGTGYSHEYDLAYRGSSQDVLAGLGISECGENACSTMPCGNGGSCVPLNSADIYECRCHPGYSGRNCQYLASESACASDPCEAGGVCSPLSEGRYFCACRPARHGESCQHVNLDEVTVPEFHGRSFAQLSISRSVASTFNFEIWFRPEVSAGILLYIGQSDEPQGDFVALYLDDGYLVFSFDVGGGSAILRSANRVPHGKFSKVQISRSNRQGVLKVNDDIDVLGEAPGRLNELNVDAAVFIGGYPGTIHKDVPVTSGFTGAIQRVYENGKLFEPLLGQARAHAHISQYEGAPCQSHSVTRDSPCLNNGVCVAVLNDYQCRCTREWAGDKCDQPLNLVDPDMPVMFDGQTGHRYPNQVTKKARSETTNDITVELRADAADGLILLVHKSSTVDGDYLAMALSGGYVEVSYNLGKQTPEDLFVLRSRVRVDDGQWHTIHLTRDHREGVLRVDGGPPVEAVSAEGASQLDTDGTLWLGHSPHPPTGLPTYYYRGLHGCIRTVSIEGTALDMAAHRLGTSQLDYCH